MSALLLENFWKFKNTRESEDIYMQNAKEYCAENGKPPKKTCQGK
jgi:hypothetical protein